MPICQLIAKCAQSVACVDMANVSGVLMAPTKSACQSVRDVGWAKLGTDTADVLSSCGHIRLM